MISPDTHRERKKLVDIVRRMLNGEVSFLDGALMIPASSTLEIDEFDVDFIPFIAINSESDRLPLGEVRRHWQPEALAKLQPEIDSTEKWAREIASQHCQRIIERFGPVAVRREIGEIARAMLGGEITFIAGAHRIALLRNYADLSAFDADMVAFVDIHSAYPSLPPTDGREHWPPEMLQEKYPEIPRAEAKAKQALAQHCQNLTERFPREQLQAPT
jgi:hypothetical protein